MDGLYYICLQRHNRRRNSWASNWKSAKIWKTSGRAWGSALMRFPPWLVLAKPCWARSIKNTIRQSSDESSISVLRYQVYWEHLSGCWQRRKNLVLLYFSIYTYNRLWNFLLCSQAWMQSCVADSQERADRVRDGRWWGSRGRCWWQYLPAKKRGFHCVWRKCGA